MAWESAVALTVKEITRSGVSDEYTLVAPTATHGNYFANTGREFIRIVNGNAATTTVTITPATIVDGLALPVKTYTIAAVANGTGLDEQFIGPFPSSWNYTGNYIWFICSAVADVTVGVFRVP